MSAAMASVPIMGFGTMESVDGSFPPEAMCDAVKTALEVGYRHFDTAEMYQTQEFVGKAIADSAVARNDLFITSKLKGLPCGDYAAVKERAASMLKKLRLDRFDLLLMHWPGPENVDWAGEPSDLAAACNFAWFRANVKSAWTNMLRLQEEGITTRIGVSNFYAAHVDELSRLFPDNPPFANQIFLDALHHEHAFVESMRKQSIAVIAYRPIAFVPAYAMAASMGDSTSDVLTRAAAQARCDSPQQLILAWLMQRGVSVIPKSTSPANIRLNFEAASKISQVDSLLLSDLSNGSETAAMCGAVDEYALALRGVAEQAEEAAK